MALSKAGLVTIGNAAAEDRKIIFDGNAQDWHIGIDDSADDLTIGLGSTLGTTSHIVIDEAGHVTMPLQSCFQSTTNPSADQANVALGSFVDIEFQTERFDLNADFNTTNYTFTAPVTGKYNFNINVRFDNCDSAHTNLMIRFTTSNRNYDSLIHNPDHDLASDGTISLSGSYLVDMDASDTAKVTVEITSGTAQTDINGGNSYFTGYLVA
tara:strand:- start:78 stop:710 length:633 start_codon:yes stop_codon:yes gene_type:complete